jgi:hypothetical protein
VEKEKKEMKVLTMTAGIRGRFIPPKCQTVADRLGNPNRNRRRKQKQKLNKSKQHSMLCTRVYLTLSCLFFNKQ